MKYRIMTGVVVIPLMIVLTTTPAYAIFGSILAGIQIYKQTTSKLTMDGQLTELTSQFSHLQEQALGSVGALTEPFTDLASIPPQFIGLGLSWKNDFTGVAADVAGAVEQMGETGKSFRESWAQRLTDADTVAESDILDLFANYRPEIAAREKGDNRLVLDHATSEVAAKEAVESYKGLRNNTNTSNTALWQSQVAGTVTQGNLTAAMAQLMAYQAAKEAAEDYEREIARREALARQVAAQQRAEITFSAQQAGLDARQQSMREGLLFRIHPNYGGPGQ